MKIVNFFFQRIFFKIKKYQVLKNEIGADRELHFCINLVLNELSSNTHLSCSIASRLMI